MATPEELQALALTNYGHYTSMRVENGRTRGLALHLERLRQDCGAVFGIELDTEYVLQAMRAVLPSDTNAVMMRVTIFEPQLSIAQPGSESALEVLVTLRPAAPLPPAPFNVMSVNYQRDMPGVKHTGLFGALAQRRQAQLSGFDDAVFLNTAGEFSEGTTWNIGFYDGTNLIWPTTEKLNGVSMQLISTLNADTAVSKPITPKHLRNIQAVFATHAGVGVRSISALDDLDFNPEADVINELQQQYLAIPGDEI